MNTIPPILATDREFLVAWRRRRDAESLRPLVERYAALVYGSALRRTGSAVHAAEATRAVFLVLARRARRLRKKTVLAGWLFHVTEVACRKLPRNPRRVSRWRWLRLEKKVEVAAEEPLWARVAPELDPLLDRLPPAQRHAVLLRVLLGWDWASTARVLRVNERRCQRRVERGLKKLTRRLCRRGIVTEAETLAQICATEGCAVPLPEALAAEILLAIEQRPGKRPSLKLARRVLFAMAWTRWRRRVVIGVPAFITSLVALVALTWFVSSLSGHSRFFSMLFQWSVKEEAKRNPGMTEPARPWPAAGEGLERIVTSIRTTRDLYQTTNIWQAHLKFTREQWKAIEPKRIAPLPHFLQPDGTVLLRNPNAQRSGLAGVLGFDFNWTSADFEFAGVAFTNVAARVKGNGTYLASLHGDKRSFKVDLNKYAKGRRLGEAEELNFHNLLSDPSCLSDALAYEFFREAGVPAPRTAYAYLSVSVAGQWEHKPLGLYAMVEPVDERFALERFGSKQTPLFKPVTYELFKYLGDDWAAYAAIYDLKTKAAEAQLRRVIEFARLVTTASDAEFVQRVGDFLDVERFARYLACEVLLANYDGFLSDGQNFYLYLDPVSNRLGFIPWDLDLAWGGFGLIGTRTQRERASIWHPWVGQHRFLERMMAVEEFRRLYRAQLEDLFARLFVPNRLYARIDIVAQAIRSPIAAESAYRLRRFEQAVGAQKVERPADETAQGDNRPVHQLKRFVEQRAISVREQLDGKAEGAILERHPL